MFMKPMRFANLTYINISKRLISNEIKEVLKIRLDPPGGANVNPLQFATVSKNLSAINVDLFVHSLSQHDERCFDAIDLLVNLRSTNLANTVLDSTHFAVVSNLLENSTIQEAVPLLTDRPKYGIFLDNFTAFAVTQKLHEEKEYILGLPLALKLILSEEVDSEFVKGFCLKAALEYLKRECSEVKPSEENVPTPRKGKVQEIKIRVKFIRNVEEPDTLKEIGKAFLKIEPTILKGNVAANAKILGFVLSKNYSELDKALHINSIEINEDVADICKKLLLRQNQEDFVNEINKMQPKLSFENFVDTFLGEACAKEAAPLAEKQKQIFPVWQKIRAQKKSEYDNEITEKQRKENIEKTAKEIAEKRDLLWFFENEEKIDLEIYNKELSSPKISIGKNEKPSDIDENYIPPEIRKID